MSDQIPSIPKANGSLGFHQTQGQTIVSGAISQEFTRLKERIQALEQTLADLPMYIDNWKWAEKHIDVLKTVPGMRFDQALEIKIGWLIPNDDGTLTDACPHK